jgi:hypothetical protein
MRTIGVYVLTAWLLAIPGTSAQAQSPTLDLPPMSNKSIVNGLNAQVPTRTPAGIQTSDDEPLGFTLSEVDRLEQGALTAAIAPSPIEQSASSSYGRSGSGIDVFVGVSIPVGDLATLGADGGKAIGGFAFGGDASLGLFPAVAWVSSVVVSINSLDLTTWLQGSGVSGDATSWTLVWAMTGLKFFVEVSPDVGVFAFGMGGVLFGSSPRITLKTETVSATQNPASTSVFGFGVGAGVNLYPVTLSVRYSSGQPEYDVSVTSSAGSASGKVKQPTSCFQFTCGVLF